MGTLDWIILAIVGIGIIAGCIKGAISQVASIIGLIVGLLVARALFVAVGDRLGEALDTSVTFARILAFVLIGLLVPLAFLLLGSLLTRLVNSLQLGCINRWLGAGVGCLKYALLLSVAFHIIDFVDGGKDLIPAEVKQQSLFYEPVKDLSSYFYPTLQDVTKQIID